MTKLASENGTNKANAQGFSAKDVGVAGVRAVVDPSVKAQTVAAPVKAVVPGKGAAPVIKKGIVDQVDDVQAVKKGEAEGQGGVAKAGADAPPQLAMVDSASAASVGSISADGAPQDGGAAGAGSGDDGDGGISAPLIIGGVLLVGGGVALAAGGGGGKKNEAPVITSGGTATIAENAAVATAVYTTTATDKNNDTLTYTLSGADAGSFNISATGVVTLKASADFEAKSSYSITVNVSDGKETASQNVSVTVTNVNEAPTITSGATATVAENAAVATEVYKVAATDPDANTTLTYSLTGADAALFNISAAGVVTLKASADFETKSKYEINVVVTDNANPALSATKAVTVNVTDVNEAPTITSGATATVAENAAVATEVYKVAATDPDANTALTYSLTGADAALFNISAAGVVTLKASADFETKSKYEINVVVTDNANPALSATKAVTVNVTDVNEAPTITSGATATVAENAAVGTVVYDANATDSDANTTLTYSLSGVDASAFNINQTTGEVTLKASANYEAKQSYDFEVVATDQGGLAATKAVTLSVTDALDQLSIDGGSIGAPLVIDASGLSGVDLLDVNYQFNETPALSEVVINHFGQNDIISFSQADAADYDYQAVGNDLVISFNGNGDLSKITLVGVLNNGAVVNSEATAEAALAAKLGATANAGGYLVGSALPETINIAAGNSTLSAAGKAATFVEDGSTESQALIQNFRSDDVVKFINAGNVGDLLFSVSAADENDLRIDYLNANNQLSTIIFDEVLAPNTGIATFADAAAALGREDFITFA